MSNQDLAKQRAELATEAYAALSSITPHKVVPSGSGNLPRNLSEFDIETLFQ